jgi:hypothetical protein
MLQAQAPANKSARAAAEEKKGGRRRRRRRKKEEPMPRSSHYSCAQSFVFALCPFLVRMSCVQDHDKLINPHLPA